MSRPCNEHARVVATPKRKSLSAISPASRAAAISAASATAARETKAASDSGAAEVMGAECFSEPRPFAQHAPLGGCGRFGALRHRVRIATATPAIRPAIARRTNLTMRVSASQPRTRSAASA